MSALPTTKSPFVTKSLRMFFSPTKVADFRGSFLYNIFIRLENDTIGKIFLILALILYFYEGFFTSYFSLNNSPAQLILLFLALIFLKKERLIASKALFWVIVFLFTVMASGIFSLILGIKPNMLLLGFLFYFQFFLALVIGMLFLSRENLARSIAFLSLPLAFVGLWQFVSNVATPREWLSPTEDIITRAYGFFGSPNVYGIFFVIMIICTLTIFLKYKKGVYLLLTIFYIFPVLISFSRTAWVSLAVSALFFFLSYKRKYLFAFPIMIFVVLPFRQFRERIGTVFTQNYLVDSVLDGRIWSLINGWHLFKNHWFLGTGPGTYGGQIALTNASPIDLQGIQNGYTALYFTDNQWLQILVQLGIIGFTIFIFFVIAALVSMLKSFNKKRDIMFLGAATVLVAFIIAGAFANVVEFSVLAVPVGLIVGASINEN